MNNKKKPKAKINILGIKNNKESENRKIKYNNNNKKKVIESYNSKNNDINSISKKINLEGNVTFDKKNNLSLFSFLSSNINQEEKATNKSIKTTKETESQLNLKYTNPNNRKKIIFNSNKINNHKEKKKISISNSSHNILLHKELDKFKNRIDCILRVIEDFELKYIHSTKSKKIQEELNKIIINKKYFDKNNISSPIQGTKNITINSNKKQMYYRRSNNNILTREENNSKTIIIKNKFNLLNKSPPKNNFNSTKNIKNKNINNSNISDKNEKNKKYYNKSEIIKNNINAYERRINYGSLIEIKQKNKEKAKIYMKKNKKDININIINKNKPVTYKLNEIKTVENIDNYKKIKKKEIINNTIYVNPSFNKTPKTHRKKEKIYKKEKEISNKYNNKKKKKFIKK